MTSDCLSSLTLTKEEETDLAELIAKDCSHSKCFSVFLFRFKGLLLKPDTRSVELKTSLPQASFTSTS